MNSKRLTGGLVLAALLATTLLVPVQAMADNDRHRGGERYLGHDGFRGHERREMRHQRYHHREAWRHHRYHERRYWKYQHRYRPQYRSYYGDPYGHALGRVYGGLTGSYYGKRPHYDRDSWSMEFRYRITD